MKRTNRHPQPLVLDGQSLTIAQYMEHLSNDAGRVELSKSAWRRINQSSDFFDSLQDKGIQCYGINTGFGDLVAYSIDRHHQDQLQANLVLSHAVGAKSRLPLNVARGIFLLRLNCLARGASGVRPTTMKALINIYNACAYPEVFSAGSMGASGDLAPLSHLAAFVTGHGNGYFRGKLVSARSIFRTLRMHPIRLGRKEGLSLINGTSAMVAVAIPAVTRLALYLETSLLGMSLLLDAAGLPLQFVNMKAFQLKRHVGSLWIARYLSTLLNRSGKAKNNGTLELQTAYCVRCAPFILGPLVESLRHCNKCLEIEANSANDNPLYLQGERRPYHGGHFHGHPVSVSLDQLRIAAVHLSGVLDRQLELVMDRKRGLKLSPFLAIDPQQGYCGLEGAQYLATSLHIENKMLANPYSPQTLPTNAGNQDYVSMGMQSALATNEMAENLQTIIGVYLLAAMQARALSSTRPRSAVWIELGDLIEKRAGGVYQDNLILRERIAALSDDEFYLTCRHLLHSHFTTLPQL